MRGLHGHHHRRGLREATVTGEGERATTREINDEVSS